MQTQTAVYFSTSSAIGLQEAVARNCVAKRSLHLVCGAFSENWHQIALACGKQADAEAVPWGMASRPERVRSALATGRYDTLCVVHSETSTSVQNPMAEIAEVIREFPDVVFCVDAVSSLGAAPVLVDDWGIDVCFASVQKGLAMPPGFAVFSVSEKAMARARAVPFRGYYFDFTVFQQYAEKSHTPTTPSIPHMYALDAQLDRIQTEGLEKRWERHRQMAEMAQAWADANFACFAEAPYRSSAVTAIKNTRGIDVAQLNQELSGQGMVLAPGYGKLKGETFRIGHVGETTPAQLQDLLDAIDRYLAKQTA
jgi:aspartate aminotransferase-like enzyme